MARTLGVCADDYGLSAGVCRSILQLVQAGRLSLVSCLAGAPAWPAFAAELARAPAVAAGRVRIGLHFNLTEGRPLSPELAARWPRGQALGALILQAQWHALPRAALAAEWRAQVAAFVCATGRAPDFVDGHQHVHHLPVVRDVVLDGVAALAATGPPPAVRATGCLPGPGFAVKRAAIAWTGGRALQRRLQQRAITHNASLWGVYDFAAPDYGALMRRWLAAIPAHGALLFCHPGDAAVDPTDPIAAARARERAYLASDAFAADLAAAGVALGPAW